MLGKVHPKNAVCNLTVGVTFEQKIQSTFLNINEMRHIN